MYLEIEFKKDSLMIILCLIILYDKVSEV